jgi:hypothetical protein
VLAAAMAQQHQGPALPVALAGDQSTPVMSPRVNRRSETPFEVVSEVKRIGSLPFGVPCGAPRPPISNQPRNREEGEHPA